MREKYVAVQDDLPEGWSITNPLSILGLGAKVASPIADPEATKELYMKLYVTHSLFLPNLTTEQA